MLGSAAVQPAAADDMIVCAQGAADEAIEARTRILTLHAEDAVAYTGRGNAYFRQGDLEQALADYTRVVELRPDAGANFRRRGLARLRLEQLDPAIADFDNGSGDAL